VAAMNRRTFLQGALHLLPFAPTLPAVLARAPIVARGAIVSPDGTVTKEVLRRLSDGTIHHARWTFSGFGQRCIEYVTWLTNKGETITGSTRYLISTRK